MRKRILTLVMALSMACSVIPAPITSYAAESQSIQANVQSFDTLPASGSLPSGITTQMCHPSYWYQKGLGNAEVVLATKDQIQQINAKALETPGAMMYDLANIRGEFNATAMKNAILEEEVPTRALYINGARINNQEYFGDLVSAIEETSYKGTQPIRYAVATTRADMRCWPTDDVIGYSPTDPDDEMEGVAVIVNEPFVIKQKCEHDGKTFYWGMSSNCTGWIEASNLAICRDYEEWIHAWKVDPKKDNFLVVTQNKIITEPSIQVPYSSKVELSLGTTLKLVPKDQIPANIGERNNWFQHVVYLPVRADDGSYREEPCLISGKYDVSIGYVPYTQKNVLDIAFTCLGDRYGWGGMLGSMDCSMYTRSIYRCFGFELPRNTNWQQTIPNTKIDLSGMTSEEKNQLISTLPIGTLLYLPGHTMVYTGTEGGKNYVISCSGSVVDSTGELTVQSVYTCILNSLDIRRRTGLTWLDSLTAAVVLNDYQNLNLKEANVITASNITKTCSNKDQSFSIKPIQTGEAPLTYKSNQSSVKVDANGKVTIKANFIGEAKITITAQETNLYKEAKKTITIRVLPGKTTLQSVKKGKSKELQVKWKLNPQASGYQLQYSTSKTFAKNAKTITISKRSTISKKIQGLKKNKVYYVRIRTYKTVSGKKLYSSWSKEKHAKVK